jgi:hypothetical protein
MHNVEFSKRGGLKVIKWSTRFGCKELVSNAYNLDWAYLNEPDAPADVIAEAERMMGGKIMTVREFEAKLATYG